MKTLLQITFILLFGSASAQKVIEFSVSNVPLQDFSNVGIRGNVAPLSWDNSIALKSVGDQFVVTVEFTGEQDVVEFKFVRYNSDKKVSWEGIENRRMTLQANGAVKSVNIWNEEQYIDPSTLAPLTVEQLQEDFKSIKTIILEAHPGTFRYNDKAVIKTALSELKNTFSTPLTHGEAYLAISKMLAQVKCDHTFASFYNQNAVIKSVIHRQADKLPFTFQWLDGKMVVDYDATAERQLTRGDEIVAINKVNAREILKTMLPYLSADGSTDGNRIKKAEIEGYDFRYDAFDVIYPLLYPLQGNEISLTVKSFGASESRNITIKTTTREKRNALLQKRYPDFPKVRDDLWDFKITEDNVGVLTLGSFGLSGWKSLTLDYKQFLSDAFARLKKQKVQNLIIDIRKNNGGEDIMAQELATYFNVSSFIDDRFEGRSRYVSFPESLKPYARTWGPNPGYYKLNPDSPNRNTEGYYVYRDEFIEKRKNKVKKTAFEGDIYLLTSAANVSLAYYLAEDAKRYKLATLVGQETGGNLQGINGGSLVFLTLPNSTIEIDFPIIGSFTTSPQPDSGVQPDISVTPTQEDLYNGRDAEIETVLQLISTKN